jgi:hypothetical protein
MHRGRHYLPIALLNGSHSRFAFKGYPESRLLESVD